MIIETDQILYSKYFNNVYEEINCYMATVTD